MTGHGLERLLERWRLLWRERPESPLLDAAWEDRVMAAVLARRRTPAPTGALARLEGLAWAAWTAGATAAGVGLVAALRLPLVALNLDQLSLVRTFYTFISLY